MQHTDFYVYVIFRPDGTPCYVGKGRNGRWLSHATSSHNKHLASIYKAAGGDLPIIKVREGLSNRDACIIEMALIHVIGREAHGGPLVNHTMGGEGQPGYVHPPEVRSAMSASRKGRRHSAETRQKMSQSQRGMKRPPGTGEKISASLKGKIKSEETKEKIRRTKTAVKFKHTEEAKRRIAAASLGRKRSQESIERTRAAHLGVPRSPETREKLRLASLGKKQSDEAKAKLRAHFLGRKRAPFTAEHIANIRAAVHRRHRCDTV